jgi:hypothetical protein
MFLKIRSVMFIPDPDSGFVFHPGSGSWIQGLKSTGSATLVPTHRLINIVKKRIKEVP